jgi:hypothetical protein
MRVDCEQRTKRNHLIKSACHLFSRAGIERPAAAEGAPQSPEADNDDGEGVSTFDDDADANSPRALATGVSVALLRVAAGGPG